MIVFVRLTILSLAVGHSQESTDGWVVFGAGLILMGLIDYYEERK